MIRPAIKGSGIVIIDKNDFISKLKGEMKTSNSYTESEDLTENALKAVKKLVNRMYRKNVISKDMYVRGS